jgi:radical SAM superfamily enzyme YgiQ (UPF0313 family)
LKLMLEKGAVRKDPGGRLNIALVYPNTYFVGMSNLGVHAMYRAFNDHPGIVCERFFSDYSHSVESSRVLSEFHIIAFSVSYELDWINAARILSEAKIPILASERNGAPVVIAGGAALTMNPEPASDMLDLCFLGDGEPAPEMLYDAFIKSPGYEEFLDMLYGSPGIYIPGRPCNKTFSHSTINPVTSPAHTSIITDSTAFSDMFLVETARGCPFSCMFCAARKIYSPFRAVRLDNLIPVFEKAKTAGLKLGMVSASLNNHPQTAAMFEVIRGMGISIAPPSLRLGMITPDLINLIESSGTKGVTLAPETGSELLRKSLSKDISNEDVLIGIEALVSAGIRDIKLYFMIGLPGETTDDIDSIIDLVKRCRQGFIKVSRGNRRIGSIQVSVNTFVPKPNTDFERMEMVDIKEAKARLKRIENGLKRQSNVRLSYESPKWTYLQAVIARGDRHVLELIIRLAYIPESSWQDALKSWERNPDYYALRQRNENETLPWGHLKSKGLDCNLKP